MHIAWITILPEDMAFQSLMLSYSLTKNKNTGKNSFLPVELERVWLRCQKRLSKFALIIVNPNKKLEYYWLKKQL